MVDNGDMNVNHHATGDPQLDSMLTCEDCHCFGAETRQGDLILCQSCADKRFLPRYSDSPPTKGVIINDLLCFAFNKMDCLPTDVITKLCTETYLEEEVVSKKASVRCMQAD